MSLRCALGGPCPQGQICVIQAGGAVGSRCEPNPCGANPISCACARILCGGRQCSEETIVPSIDADISCTYRCDMSPCPP
jgi:hypothetical protein